MAVARVLSTSKVVPQSRKARFVEYHDGADFIPGGDDLEQQVRTSLVDRQIAKFIKKEE